MDYAKAYLGKVKKVLRRFGMYKRKYDALKKENGQVDRFGCTTVVLTICNRSVKANAKRQQI